MSLTDLPTATSGYTAPSDNWQNQSMAEQAYCWLERLIVTMRLEPGALVTERELIDLTGMGRTPVREAIQRLAWEGLMEVRPRSGIAITSTSPGDFNKVLDAREGVEIVMARAASKFGSQRDFERLELAANQMRDAVPDNDVIRFLDADKAFDLVLATAADNRFAAALAGPLQTHSRRLWFRLQPRANIHDSALAHRALIAAITSRDSERAAGAARDLIGYLRKLTL